MRTELEQQYKRLFGYEPQIYNVHMDKMSKLKLNETRNVE